MKYMYIRRDGKILDNPTTERKTFGSVEARTYGHYVALHGDVVGEISEGRYSDLQKWAARSHSGNDKWVRLPYPVVGYQPTVLPPIIKNMTLGGMKRLSPGAILERSGSTVHVFNLDDAPWVPADRSEPVTIELVGDFDGTEKTFEEINGVRQEL